MKRLIFLILFIFLSLNYLAAQKNDKKIPIAGTVTDANGDPIANAIIMIDGQKTKTITDAKGKYKIKVDETISRIGIFTFGCGIYEEDIEGRSRIDIIFNMIPKQNEESRISGITIPVGKNFVPGEEPVEIGYATLKKKYVTTDISFIDGREKKFASYSSVTEMIIRNVSGVMQIGDRIIIQGSSNISGYVGPIIIIDGTEGGNLNDVSPIMVESICVLKGTAAAIYGSRGYGGAIIIKTKKYDE